MRVANEDQFLFFAAFDILESLGDQAAVATLVPLTVVIQFLGSAKRGKLYFAAIS